MCSLRKRRLEGASYDACAENDRKDYINKLHIMCYYVIVQEGRRFVTLNKIESGDDHVIEILSHFNYMKNRTLQLNSRNER